MHQVCKLSANLTDLHASWKLRAVWSFLLSYLFLHRFFLCDIFGYGVGVFDVLYTKINCESPLNAEMNKCLIFFYKLIWNLFRCVLEKISRTESLQNSALFSKENKYISIFIYLFIYLFTLCLMWKIISWYKNDNTSYTELWIIYANLCQPNKTR